MERCPHPFESVALVYPRNDERHHYHQPQHVADRETEHGYFLPKGRKSHSAIVIGISTSQQRAAETKTLTTANMHVGTRTTTDTAIGKRFSHATATIGGPSASSVRRR